MSSVRITEYRNTYVGTTIENQFKENNSVNWPHLTFLVDQVHEHKIHSTTPTLVTTGKWSRYVCLQRCIRSTINTFVLTFNYTFNCWQSILIYKYQSKIIAILYYSICMYSRCVPIYYIIFYVHYKNIASGHFFSYYYLIFIFIIKVKLKILINRIKRFWISIVLNF